MFAGEDAAIEVDARRRPRAPKSSKAAETPESPIADARRRRGRERRERRPRGSRRRRCLDGSGLARFRQPWREGAWRSGRIEAPSSRETSFAAAGAATPGTRARECVLCDEYAYIRAKRGRRRIGFVTVSGAKPDRARAKGAYFAATLFWPAKFGQRRAHLALQTAPICICGAFLQRRAREANLQFRFMSQRPGSSRDNILAATTKVDNADHRSRR